MCEMKKISTFSGGNMKEKKLAYIKAYDKRGLTEFCRYLVEYGYELIAEEDTLSYLQKAEIPVRPVCGKNVFDLNIQLAIVNLYPFKKDMESGSAFRETAALIDTQGVAALSAAAKNFGETVAVCDPDDYEKLLCGLAVGEISEEDRMYFMYKAFSYTAAYHALVSQYLARELNILFPQTLTITYEKAQDMRYGENPHQRAAVYREPLLKEGSLARAKQLSGPVISYNNVNDANTAIGLVKEFEGPTVAVCKHCTPCSVGTGESVYEAFEAAYLADPLKMYGGILAVNGVLDARTAEALKNLSAEVVVAVGFTPEAMNVLQFERSLILLEMPEIRSKVQFTFHLQKIYGGLLMQTYDTFTYENARCVTERAPTANERKALDFNYKVAKHARSSAVVIGKDGVTAGIGTGQTNRTLALKAALSIAGKGAAGCVAVSDFRFPTLECVELCHAAGITAIMQTGESPLDEEMIELCNKYRIAMLFTGARHFKN